MRRLLAAALVLSLGSLVGLAWAATITGTEGPDRLRGTAGADVLQGRGGDDVIEGRAGADLAVGGPGRDTLVGGAGDDRLAAHADGSREGVRCGTGRDIVNAELRDSVAADCEVVSRQLSRDPYDNFEGSTRPRSSPTASPSARRS